jgi:phosphatidylglycerophosphate synthase
VNTAPIEKHIRQNRGLLSSAEKRTLHWMARRLPPWVNPDHLTLLALIAMAGAGVSFWAARWNRNALLLVVVSLAVNWFGDSLDGTLARIRNRQRPRYGFYVDHVADVTGLLFLFGGLAASGFMTPLIALGLLVAYLAVASEVFLSTCVQGVFRLSSLGFGPTELRIILAAGALYLIYSPVVRLGSLGSFLLFDAGGIIAIGGLVAVFALSAARNTFALYRAEPPCRQ